MPSVMRSPWPEQLVQSQHVHRHRPRRLVPGGHQQGGRRGYLPHCFAMSNARGDLGSVASHELRTWLSMPGPAPSTCFSSWSRVSCLGSSMSKLMIFCIVRLPARVAVLLQQVEDLGRCHVSHVGGLDQRTRPFLSMPSVPMTNRHNPVALSGADPDSSGDA
jgi:hypothetical protein